MKTSLSEAVSAFQDARGVLGESMYISNIAVRYPGGEIEGFSGTSTAGASRAEAIAQRKAKKKAKMLGTPDVMVLTPQEFAKISHKDRRKLERDWKNSSRFDEAREMSFLKATKLFTESAVRVFGEKSPEAALSRAAFSLVEASEEPFTLSMAAHGAGLSLEAASDAAAALVSADTEWCGLEDNAQVRIWDNGKTDQVRYNIAIYDEPRAMWDVFQASDLQGPQGVFTLQAEMDVLPAEGFEGEETTLEKIPQAVQTEVQRRLGAKAEGTPLDAEVQTEAKGEAKKDKDGKSEKTDKDAKPEKPEKLDAKGLKELTEKALPILANVLAVGLSQIESQLGHTFESSIDAKKFLIQALTQLRTSGQTEITDAVRRFDRIGGERLVMQYRRELGDLL